MAEKMFSTKTQNKFLFFNFKLKIPTMSKDLNQVFEELLNRYVKTIAKDYKERYKRAKDKEFIKDELKKGTDLTLDWAFHATEKGKLIKVFSEMYKRGEDMYHIIAHLRKEFGEVEDVKPYQLIEDGKKITLYLSEEEKVLKKLALNERKLLKFLIRNEAYREIQKKFPTMFEEEVSSTKSKKNNTIVQWTSAKDTKNEFVQLIYGLHQAGFINKGKGEITKITEALSDMFEIDLGKNWQSNHSASIHKAKNNYQPPIFTKIKEAYLKYAETLVEEKNKKK